jgi:hypothetical protein
MQELFQRISSVVEDTGSLVGSSLGTNAGKMHVGDADPKTKE